MCIACTDYISVYITFKYYMTSRLRIKKSHRVFEPLVRGPVLDVLVAVLDLLRELFVLLLQRVHLPEGGEILLEVWVRRRQVVASDQGHESQLAGYKYMYISHTYTCYI